MSWGRRRRDRGWGRDAEEIRTSYRVTIREHREVVPGGIIRSMDKTAYDAGDGFYLGIPDDTALFGIGDETNFLTWDGSTLTVSPNLAALSADLGTITAGQIQLGSGTLGTDFTGLVLDSAGLSYSGDTWHLVGLESETLQFGVNTDDGKFYAGGGAVILDQFGISILIEEDANPIRFIDSNGSLFGHLQQTWSSPDSNMQLSASPLTATGNAQLQLRSRAEVGSNNLAANLILNTDYDALPETILSWVSKVTAQPAYARVVHNTAATPADGLGAGFQFQVETSTTPSTDVGRLAFTWATVTHASRAGRFALYVNDSGGEREALRAEGDGSQALLGFFGSAAAAKPSVTGSRAGNAALADLLTDLAGLGLITDNTTA